VAFAPDGQTLAYGAGNEVVVANVATGEETAVLTGYPAEQTITQIRWSPDGMALVAGSVTLFGETNGGVNILWEQTADGQWTAVFQAEHIYNYGYPDGKLLLFNPTGSLLAFESLAKEGAPYQIFVYDRQQAAVILTLESYRLRAWQSDELLLTTGPQGENWLTQWHVHSREKVVGMGQEGGDSAYLPGGLFFAALSSRGRIIEVRDWLTNQIVAQGQAGRSISQNFWSPDGRFLAAAADDGTIMLWPVQWLPE
jgi:WD40 repeat protein